MKFGRMGLEENGEVVLGDVTSTQFKRINTINELRVEIDNYDLIVCAGIMNRLFNGQRTIDFLLDNYKHPEEKIIPSLNVKYYSEVNRVTGYKHIFYNASNKVSVWDTESIENWTTGEIYKIARVVMVSLIDFVKTSCSETRYQELMENAKGELKSSMEYASSIVGETILTVDDLRQKCKGKQLKEQSDVFKAYKRAAYWERNVSMGEILTAGVSIDGGIIVSREDSGNIFAGVEDNKYYVINVYGYHNRVRFDKDYQSLKEYILENCGLQVDNPLQFIVSGANHDFRIKSDRQWGALIRRNRSLKDIDKERAKYIEAQCNIIKHIKSNIGASYIYDISTESMSFAFRNSVKIKEAIKVVNEATNKYMPNIFETLSIDHKRRKVNGSTRYWDFDMINVIPISLIDTLDETENVETRLDAGIWFNRAKTLQGVKA